MPNKLKKEYDIRYDNEYAKNVISTFRQIADGKKYSLSLREVTFNLDPGRIFHKPIPCIHGADHFRFKAFMTFNRNGYKYYVSVQIYDDITDGLIADVSVRNIDANFDDNKYDKHIRLESQAYVLQQTELLFFDKVVEEEEDNFKIRLFNGHLCAT